MSWEMDLVNIYVGKVKKRCAQYIVITYNGREC